MTICVQNNRETSKTLDFTGHRGNALYLRQYLEQVYSREKATEIFNSSDYTDIIAHLEYQLGSVFQIKIDLSADQVDAVNKKVKEFKLNEQRAVELRRFSKSLVEVNTGSDISFLNGPNGCL